MEDPHLEEALKGGDEAALAKYFELHRERLWRMVRFRLDSRLAGRVDPDDVLQEAFMDAVTRLPHFDGAMTVFFWLRWVVQQTMIGIHRRHLGTQMRSAHREQPLGGPATSQSLAAQLAGTSTSPSEAAIRDERVQAVMTALEEMSAIDREVIALRHFEDLTNSEVAQALQITAKTASIRYVRALSRLCKVMELADPPSAIQLFAPKVLPPPPPLDFSSPSSSGSSPI